MSKSNTAEEWATPEVAAAELQNLGIAGYEQLLAVLRRAFLQAAVGKGNERHANGEPFERQVMQDGAHRFGHGGLFFQAFKKTEESQRLPHDAAVREVLGAIVYLAGAVIAMERRERAFQQAVPVAANDNVRSTKFCCGDAPGTCIGCPRHG